MIIQVTSSGKRFVWDRCKFVLVFQDVRYFQTGSGNIIRENLDGTFDEIPKATVEANILLLPYEVAAAMFPANAALVETI